MRNSWKEYFIEVIRNINGVDMIISNAFVDAKDIEAKRESLKTRFPKEKGYRYAVYELRETSEAE